MTDSNFAFVEDNEHHHGENPLLAFKIGLVTVRPGPITLL